MAVPRNLPGLAGKKLEPLLQAAPGTTRLGFPGSAADPATRLFVGNRRGAGVRLGFAVLPWRVRCALHAAAALGYGLRRKLRSDAAIDAATRTRPS